MAMLKIPTLCPPLFLAPMEGVGDRPFRRAMAAVGGMNETCTEFLRVPCNAHVPSLAKRYVANETSPVPQAAQIMGSDPLLMAAMAQEMEARGAHRIDLNCGCPSNTVTGRGAGSSLLKDPDHLYRVAKAMVEAVNVPVTAKLRSGFSDTSLFRENILAAQESGIHFLTLHPRTKVDGYGPPAKWEFIAEAKALLKIPVIGNGDIISVDHALKMLSETKCDGLMIGRGAAIKPWLFLEIRAHFEQVSFDGQKAAVKRFLETYVGDIPEEMPLRTRVSKLKQLASFLYRADSKYQEKRQALLTSQETDHRIVLKTMLYDLTTCDELSKPTPDESETE